MSKYFPDLKNGTDVADVEQIEQAFDLVETDIGAVDSGKADKTDVDTALSTKANQSDVYTKTETDNAISAAIADSVGDIDTALDGIIALQNSLIGGGTV